MEIHELIKYQKVDLIEEYISKGNDLNLVDKNKNTPYHLIIKDYYNVDLLKKMINKKTCWHNLDYQKNSILSLILSNNQYFEDLEEVLLIHINKNHFKNEERLNYLVCSNLKLENILKLKDYLDFSLPEKNPALFSLLENEYLKVDNIIDTLKKLNLSSYDITDFYGNSLFIKLVYYLVKNNIIIQNLSSILDNFKKLGIKMDHLEPISGEQPFRILVFNHKKLNLSFNELFSFYQKNKIDPNKTNYNGINLGMFLIIFYSQNNITSNKLLLQVLNDIDNFYQVNVWGESLWDYLETYFQSLLNKFNHKKYKQENIKMDKNETSLATYFRARLDDILIYFHLLETKYKNLKVPRIRNFAINNRLNFDGSSLMLPTDLDISFGDLPYYIAFLDKDNYYINPYLNLIINKIKNKGEKDYAIVFLSLISKSGGLHANILLYDFINKRIERFEPYGNTTDKESDINEILEEELTWNTGLTYLSNQETSPHSGVQALSDESNELNNKPGDFGGFCLAWCLWYVELRLKNPEIYPKILINKAITRIIEDNEKPYFINHIRDYGNKITKEKFSIYKKIKLKQNIWTNLTFDDASNELIENFISSLN